MDRLTRGLLSSTAALALIAYGGSGRAASASLDMPAQPLEVALNSVGLKTDSEVLFSKDLVAGRRAPALKGRYEPEAALQALLAGTDLHVEKTASNVYVIAPPQKKFEKGVQVAAATRPIGQSSGVETVVVTAEKKSEDIQNVPIAVSAFTQRDLKERQVATGGDLIRETPNMNFGKTNFSGYSIELRGIGTQAISVTTDPAVAVAFNGVPFIRNHFFEQEFFDVDNVEVLRGPQGTLYGRNATAGVVNIISAKPTDEYDAMGSVDVGNYSNRRLEGMINLPVVPDKLEIRVAGEWTKRDGYTEDTTLNTSVDGRDLWSTRATIAFNPTSDLQTNLVWEHFSEDDDRLRSGKQLCETDTPPTSIDGVPVPGPGAFGGAAGALNFTSSYLSQGCKATSLYAPTAFQVPYGPSLPYVLALQTVNAENTGLDPYAETTQSTNLRDIQSAILPHYRAKNDLVELNADYIINPVLTLASQTGFNQDYLYSTEDYNRFDTTPGVFDPSFNSGNCGLNPPICFKPDPEAGVGGIPANAKVFCDPQLGCSDRIVVQDLNDEHAWQLSQEFRLASTFSGPFNFSVGTGYLHYETEENYYVFANALTATALLSGGAGNGGGGVAQPPCQQVSIRFGGGYQSPNPIAGGGQVSQDCIYIDPNPIATLNNQGHNYFLSQNPYTLNSYAVFGEAYYNITNDLKLTGGLRWTVDQKHFVNIPSEVVDEGYGYWVNPPENQEWDRPTGRAVLDWTPELSFTDQTLLYGSVAHGYKAGGANPPGAVFPIIGASRVPFVDHPLTFKPEYINAFELGTKNTLLDETLTLNADVFYYNYTGYQISEIVDRTAINNNYNAHAEGAEVESVWEPSPGLKFNFAGGWEDTGVAGGQTGIDLIDRTAGMPGWMVVKPFATAASNCIVPDYVVGAALAQFEANPGTSHEGVGPFICSAAYTYNVDPITLCSYVPNPTTPCALGKFNEPAFIPAGYPGFNPLSPAINNGEGFAKNLKGHQLPNAPPFTVSFGSQYTMPVWTDWSATLRGDFYWQGSSFARVFNDRPYDQLHGYTNVNVALILNSADGWQVMGYVKNVFNTTATTGDFLNSDDSGLTTNVFLTDPRLFGVRITKDFEAGDGNGGYGVPEFLSGLFSDEDGGRPPVWIELGGNLVHVTGQGEPFVPAFLALYPNSSVMRKPSPVQAQNPLSFGFDEEAKVSFEPDRSDWIVSAAVRIGRSGDKRYIHHQTDGVHHSKYASGAPVYNPTNPGQPFTNEKFANTSVQRLERHTILDFMAGKDLGLGFLGLEGSSVLSGGVRIAQFSASESLDLRARPDLQFKYYPSAASPNKINIGPYFHTYHVTEQAARKFHGVGPSISWNGSTPVMGALADGELSFDWGANAALLIGRQTARVKHQGTGRYFPQLGLGLYSNSYLVYHKSGGHTISRSRDVANIGGFAGMSYRFNNAKVSFGYRADAFFGAMDVGIDRRKDGTVGFFGPFANISFGIGG